MMTVAARCAIDTVGQMNEFVRNRDLYGNRLHSRLNKDQMAVGSGNRFLMSLRAGGRKVAIAAEDHRVESLARPARKLVPILCHCQQTQLMWGKRQLLPVVHEPVLERGLVAMKNRPILERRRCGRDR